MLPEFLVANLVMHQLTSGLVLFLANGWCCVHSLM